MSNPNNAATQISAFEGMFPNVKKIQEFYITGKEIDEALGEIVRYLIESDSIGEQSSILHQLAVLLNFALTFDRCKMMRPAVQNDFSFYRRALGKNARHPGVPVSDTEANNISMFIAQASPIVALMSSVCDKLQRELQVTSFLARFAHICCTSILVQKQRDNAQLKFSLTAMVVALVLYDQISPTGVFTASEVQLKTCVSQLRYLPVDDRTALSDALQYSTRNFNKAPDSIKKMITTY